MPVETISVSGLRVLGLTRSAAARRFRGEKKELKKRERDDAAERDRLNYGIPLLPASSEDAETAKRQMYGKVVGGAGEDTRFEQARRHKRKTIMRAPLFAGTVSLQGGELAIEGGEEMGVAEASASWPAVSSGVPTRKAVLGVVLAGKRAGGGLVIVAQPSYSISAAGSEGGRSSSSQSALDSLGVYDDSD